MDQGRILSKISDEQSVELYKIKEAGLPTARKSILIDAENSTLLNYPRAYSSLAIFWITRSSWLQNQLDKPTDIDKVSISCNVWGDSMPAHKARLLYLSAVIFCSLLYQEMVSLKLALALLLLSTWTVAQNTVAITSTVPSNVQPVNKGMTFQATVFPTYENSWAGRFSCNNCNPFEGDQPCTMSLPLVCISNYKTVNRPHYTIAVQYTPFAITDGGYYDGWTGGVFTTTLPVRGSDIRSYQVGDKLCKGYFGNNSRWAKFDDGWYMPYMNQLPQKSWSFWDWNKASKGGWNMWGFFNHHYRGRAWVWIDNQANGNCA